MNSRDKGVLGPVFWVLAALFVLPFDAHAACTVNHAHVKLPVSADALVRRDLLYVELCRKLRGHLVDVTDPTLSARLQNSGPPILPDHDYYPHEALIAGWQGAVLVGFLIRIDGSTSDVTVLESSGYPILDTAGVRLIEDTRYPTPARLDGNPIVVISYMKVPFRYSD